MIVKNEQDFLEGALASAVDIVDELVVVDTGSTDRTVDIARSYGAKVHRFAWTQSFSEARNESLRHVNGRWVVVLDADERFVGDGWGKLRDHLSVTTESVGYAVLLVNKTLSGRPMSSFYPARIFPNDGSLLFRGRVHNRPEKRSVVGEPYPHRSFAGPEIVHFGYDVDIYARREKAKRSLPLIEAELEERPDDLLYRYYRARELLTVRRTQKGPSDLRASQRELEELVEVLVGLGRGPLVEVAQQLFIVYELLHVGERAVTQCERLCRQIPYHPDLRMGLAQSYLRVGAHDRAVEAANVVLDTLKAAPRAKESIRYRPWAVQELVAACEIERDQPERALAALLEALRIKREDDDGWPELLSTLVVLAQRLGHRELTESVLLALLGRRDADPDPFFAEVDRRCREESTADGLALLRRGLQVAPAIVKAPQLGAFRAMLEAHDH